jgi:competence protein ComEA
MRAEMIRPRAGRVECVVAFAPDMLLERLVAAAIVTVLVSAVAARAQDPLPEGPGRKSVETACSACHDLATVTEMRRSRAAWQEVVEAMVNRGARATDQELDAIVSYLAGYFGVVNVNKAAAEEIARVLGVPSREADAIVRYRAERGEFTDLEGLKKVPGVDAEAIEERKDRIAFK